jgi:O-antigen biosynthesis protein WbqP
MTNNPLSIIDLSQKTGPALGVFNASPGITGLAQIQGIDMSTPELLAKTDAEMLKRLDLLSYFRFIFLTVLGKGSGDRVREKST